MELIVAHLDLYVAYLELSVAQVDRPVAYLEQTVAHLDASEVRVEDLLECSHVAHGQVHDVNIVPTSW